MATLALSGASVFKAGAGVSTSITEAQHDYALLQAESHICTATRFNWVDVYGSLNVDIKYILEETCSDLAAMYLINFDMSGYTSRSEALAMLDVLRDKVANNIKTLSDDNIRKFVNAA